ncbi:MAG TPA: hypothetical protein VFG30_08070 [Polyangiales bacterium]|nr:hypothetical protein [Polyangiales bacterium]
MYLQQGGFVLIHAEAVDREHAARAWVYGGAAVDQSVLAARAWITRVTRAFIAIVAANARVLAAECSIAVVFGTSVLVVARHGHGGARACQWITEARDAGVADIQRTVQNLILAGAADAAIRRACIVVCTGGILGAAASDCLPATDARDARVSASADVAVIALAAIGGCDRAAERLFACVDRARIAVVAADANVCAFALGVAIVRSTGVTIIAVICAVAARRTSAERIAMPEMGRHGQHGYRNRLPSAFLGEMTQVYPADRGVGLFLQRANACPARILCIGSRVIRDVTSTTGHDCQDGCNCHAVSKAG